MSDYPKTIKNPKRFAEAKPAGFDGTFDWSWTEGCFGKTKITPMDIDGIVERNGYFLVFETKEPGAPIPLGQQITLDRLAQTGRFTIMYIYGKQEPERIILQHGKGRYEYRGVEMAKKIVSRWYEYADKKKA